MVAYGQAQRSPAGGGTLTRRPSRSGVATLSTPCGTASAGADGRPRGGNGCLTGLPHQQQHDRSGCILVSRAVFSPAGCGSRPAASHSEVRLACAQSARCRESRLYATKRGVAREPPHLWRAPAARRSRLLPVADGNHRHPTRLIAGPHRGSSCGGASARPAAGRAAALGFARLGVRPLDEERGAWPRVARGSDGLIFDAVGPPHRRPWALTLSSCWPPPGRCWQCWTTRTDPRPGGFSSAVSRRPQPLSGCRGSAEQGIRRVTLRAAARPEGRPFVRRDRGSLGLVLARARARSRVGGSVVGRPCGFRASASEPCLSGRRGGSERPESGGVAG